MALLNRFRSVAFCIAVSGCWMVACGSDDKKDTGDVDSGVGSDGGSGGSESGGSSGMNTGGSNTGGSNTGGTGTGGSNTGGTSTGGTSTGGTSTGGNGTGGTDVDAGSGGTQPEGGGPEAGADSSTEPDAEPEAPASICGDDIVDTGIGEECEPPGTVFCDANCHLGGQCTECEETNCGGASIHENCSTAGANPDLCVAALQCSRDNGCYELTQADCYCGAAVDVTECQTGAAEAVGPCKAEYDAAAEIPNASTAEQGTVMDRMGDTTYAIGNMGFVQLCDQAFCPVCFP